MPSNIKENKTILAGKKEDGLKLIAAGLIKLEDNFIMKQRLKLPDAGCPQAVG